MHDIKAVLDAPSAFDEVLARRNLPPQSAELKRLDDARRTAVARLQQVQERRNAASKDIGQAIAQKDSARVDALKAEVAQLKNDFPALEQAERQANAALEAALAVIPNLPLPEVPQGRNEDDNVQLALHGEKPKFTHSFKPKEHFDLGEALGLMDFDHAAKISGARFVILKGALARLQRALGQFMLDVHTQEHGYQEVAPPVLVRDHALYGTAQLPKFAEDLFRTTNDLWLVPTAEVPLTNLVRESVIEETQLPIRVTALTPCFRSEAGSAGRDTRGMIRLHQFDKVELVSIVRPQDGEAELERMTKAATTILQKLGLAFRVMMLCTGDMGFSARKTYDIEVWLAGQDRYREISSCSLCGDFQTRRMSARFRDGKNLTYPYSLNGSGVAVGRALVAVMENYQNEDGSITVPAALRPYMNGLTCIAAP